MTATAPIYVAKPGFIPGVGGAVPTSQATPQTTSQSASQPNQNLPAGSILPGSGVADGNGGFTPTVGTMTANISTPSATQTSPAPAVVTSANAQTDLTSKQAQVDQLNADTANHNAAITASAAPAQTPTDTKNGSTQNTPNSAEGGSSMDNEVNDLLTSFDQNAATVNSNAQAQEGDLGDEATQTQATLDQQAQTSLGQLAQIASGTYPLSPAEQNILSATQTQFMQAYQYQTQANTSYTGQMTEAMASLGISTSAPTQSISMINAAITEGTNALTNISSNMAISLGNLQLAFQKEDFSEVQSSWDETSKYLQDRIDTLTTMQTNVQTEANNQITEMQTNTKDTIDALISAGTLDQKTIQDAATNALAQGRLNLDQWQDIQTNSLKAQANAIAAGKTTAPQLKAQGATILQNAFTPGATWTDSDTGNTESVFATGTHTITTNALQNLLGELPEYSMTPSEFFQSYGQYIATDPKTGLPDKSYGLTPAQTKLFTDITPTITDSTITPG